MRPKRRNPDHDPRLNGLRALAVLSVLAFHLGLPLPGGYMGVDIFFVLSGYLIARSLLQSERSGGSLFRWFYRRRVMRLVPSLLVVLAAVVLVAPLVLLPPELSFLGQSILATALLAPNLLFWSSFDYFSASAQDSPLLHLWSLGVEAQFYLVAPFLVMLRGWIDARWLQALLCGAVVLSFALALYAQAFHPKAGFYWMPTRFWQFGLGAAVAMNGVRFGPWASAAGIASIIGGLLAAPLDPFIAMIGVSAGTALLIAAPRTGFWARILAADLPGWIGGRAYTLYLVHWPLIVFASLVWGPASSAGVQLSLALASLALAAAVTRWVEQPMMRSSRFRPVALGAVFGLAIGAVFLSQSFWRGLYPSTVADLAAYASYKEREAFHEQTRLHRCFVIDRTRGGVAAFDRSTCLPARDGRPEMLLIGDSHAAHLSAALRAQGTWQVAQVTMAGCRPLISDDPVGDCADLMSRSLRGLHPDLWVISARWQAEELAQLVATVDRLSGRVVVLGPVPEYPGGLPQKLARDLWTGRDTARLRADPRLSELDAKTRRALAGSSATYVSLLDLLCPQGECKTRVGAVPLQFDYGHFTAEGAKYVVSRISPFLAPAASQVTMVQHGAK